MIFWLNIRKAVLAFSWLLLMFNFNSVAQNVHYAIFNSSNNGLANDIVKSITQDTMGFVWIASDGGLSRFDGVNIKNFSKEQNFIVAKSIIRTKKGKLIAATDLSVFKVNSQHDTATFEIIVQGDTCVTPGKVQYPKLMFEDSQENLWIPDLTSLCKYKNKELKRYFFDSKVTTSSYNRSFSVVENANGHMLAFSENGYSFYYEERVDSFIEMKTVQKFNGVSYAIAADSGNVLIASGNGIFELSSDLKNATVKNICPDINANCIVRKKDKSYIISTWNQGLFLMKKTNNGYFTQKLSGFPIERANFLYLDNSENIFVATDAGMVFVQFMFFQTWANELSQDFINAINFYPETGALITASGGIYSAQYNDNGLKITRVAMPEISGNKPTNVVQSKNEANSYWIITNYTTVYYIQNRQVKKTFCLDKTGKSMPYCFEDSEGNFWACIDGAPFVVKINKNFEVTAYNNSKGIQININIIRQDAHGDIYACGRGKDEYLYKYNRATDSFENLSYPLNFEPTPDFIILDMAFRENEIWLASSLGLIKVTKGKSERIDLDEFTEERMISIAVDKRGTVWFANANGIFSLQNNLLYLYKVTNNISSVSPTYRCLSVDSMNRLWLGTSMGLTISQNPAEIRKTNRSVIEHVFVDDQEIKNIHPEFIFHKGSYLTVKFVPVAYPGNEVNYQYQLTGTNGNWINLYSKNELMLPNLKNGHYTLQIRSKLYNNYDWSNVASIKFWVIPPWYRTWWFISLITIGIICILLLIYIARVSKLKKRQLILEQLVIERTSQIQEQNNILSQQTAEITTQNDLLQSQKEELEKLNAWKDKMFSIIAHDLRNPIGNIIGFVRLYKMNIGKWEPDRTMKWIKDMESISNSSLFLLENLLYWGHSQLSEMSVHPVIQPINNIIDDNMQVIFGNAQQKQISCEYVKTNDLVAYFDKDMMSVVVRNLLTNALKYTPASGKITVTVEDGDASIIIKVKDNGIGFDSAKMKDLLKKRAIRSTDGTDHEKGSGFGLLLCKELIEMNHGKFMFESVINEGSTFSFTCPKSARF